MEPSTFDIPENPITLTESSMTLASCVVSTMKSSVNSR